MVSVYIGVSPYPTLMVIAMRGGCESKGGEGGEARARAGGS